MPSVQGLIYRLGEAKRRTSFAARGLGSYARLRLERDAARPRIAAVMVGRNDDYMSDFRERLHATLEWNLRHIVDEAVFVEWNPTPDRELLAHGLTKKFQRLRAYVVPSEVHEGLCENPHVKLLEYHAKNVGIRRARAPWVLVTNADAALALDTVARLRRTRLDPQVAWTAERVDIAWREGEQREIGLLDTLRYTRPIPYHRLGTGEFILASRELWERVRGYDERLVRHRIGCDVRGTAQMLAHGARIDRAGIVLHLQHPTSCTEKLQPHHGELATVEGVPYQNTEDWGLGAAREVEIGERIWRLETPPAGA